MPAKLLTLSFLLLLSACSTSTSPQKPKTIITQNSLFGSTYLRTTGFHRFGFHRTSQRTVRHYTVRD